MYIYIYVYIYIYIYVYMYTVYMYMCVQICTCLRHAPGLKGCPRRMRPCVHPAELPCIL